MREMTLYRRAAKAQRREGLATSHLPLKDGKSSGPEPDSPIKTRALVLRLAIVPRASSPHDVAENNPDCRPECKIVCSYCLGSDCHIARTPRVCSRREDRSTTPTKSIQPIPRCAGLGRFFA